MVMQYQGSNQSMDNLPQNLEHDDIVNPALYLAGDSVLWQQQLRQNWSEASNWSPRGGGIMRMNMLELQSYNQGFEESNIGSEESEEIMMNCFYLPPSPTNFPLYRPLPSVFFVSSNIQENISLALSYQHILEDKSGALHVLNGVECKEIIYQLLFVDFRSYVGKFDPWDQIVRAAGVVPEDMVSLLVYIASVAIDEREVTLRQINWVEQHDEDVVHQPFFELAAMVEQLIQNKSGELDVILGGGVLTVNRLERSNGQGSSATPETLLICQTNFSFRVWLEHGGQWAAETRFRCNRLNTGNFTTAEDAISAYEWVARWSGWMDLIGIPGLFENGNKSKLSPQLPPTAQEEKQGEDFVLVRCSATGNDEIEAVGTGSEGTREWVMAEQARLNSGCLGKRKTKEKNPGGERKNKKTNGVRIAIPPDEIFQTKGMRLKDAANHLEVSQSALKHACWEYGIHRWPPRKLITQSHPNETPALVDQEGIPQSNSYTLPPDQALAATVEKITSVVGKEILPLPFSPTAPQESLDEDFCNFEAAEVGIGSGGTGQSEIEEGQLNSRYLGKEKKKEMIPRGERRNK